MSGQTYGIENIHYLLSYEIDEPAPPPPPPPVEERFITVIDSPDIDLLPVDSKSGDAVVSKSDLNVYSLNSPTISDNVREVMVVSDVITTPPEALPGDVVYNETTSDLFQVGE